MNLFFNNAKNSLLCVGGVAIAWIFFFKLNIIVFSFLEKSPFFTLVFMPAGLRLVAVLIFNELGVIGLFLGALITSPIVGTNTTEALIISLISAPNPYLSVLITKRLLNVDNLLKKLHAKELILMGLFSALLNSLSHYFYFGISNLHMSWGSFEDMFIGDLLGITLMLFIFSLSLKLIRKSTLTGD